MRQLKTLLSVLLFCLFSCVCAHAGQRAEWKTLSDRLQQEIGKKDFLPIFKHYLQLAQTHKDTVQMEVAFYTRMMHYYTLGDIDTLRLVTYEYMEWTDRCHFAVERYQAWRQYIQRMTEKGMQEEAMSETEKLSKDAEKRNDIYGLACSEMCVGYNHRIFGNNSKLCLKYYDNALNHFETGRYFKDAYVVYLNIIQAHLARQSYSEAIPYLDRLKQLKQHIEVKGLEVGDDFHMRYYQFRVISVLGTQGKQAAEPFITDAENYYQHHKKTIPLEAWLAYKIMCNQILGDLRGAITCLDSLLDYHRSMGNCYPGNYMQKALLLEQLGDTKAACKAYSNYIYLNDSVRTVEMDAQLSKYTVQFEVNRLKMEKLEIRNKMNQDRLTMVLTGGGLVVLLLILVTYLYFHTLSMNKKLAIAHKEVKKMSRVKISFIQHITHELRTPLNSVVGFSTLIAEGGLSEEEAQEYALQVETNSTCLLALMENIIDIADIDSQTADMPKQAVDMNACCQECMENVRKNLKKDIALKLNLDPSNPVIQGIPVWVKRVLAILLDNAVKFTEKGEIRLICEEDKAHRVIRFMVEDTGIGVEAPYIDRLFDRFFKADSFTPGTGLGLAIAYQVLEIVNGKIYLDTTYTEGARFVVEWPAS